MSYVESAGRNIYRALICRPAEEYMFSQVSTSPFLYQLGSWNDVCLKFGWLRLHVTWRCAHFRGDNYCLSNQTDDPILSANTTASWSWCSALFCRRFGIAKLTCCRSDPIRKVQCSPQKFWEVTSWRSWWKQCWENSAWTLPCDVSALPFLKPPFWNSLVCNSTA